MDILNAAGNIGIFLKKVASTKGGEYAGPCPSCGGKDRFRCWPVNGGGGSYWCRQCGKGGDLVQFLVDYCRYNYPDAFTAAGRSKPADYRPGGYRPVIKQVAPVFEPREYEKPVETWQNKALEFVEQAHHDLLNYEHAMKYLKTRGLNAQAVKTFHLGWYAGERGKNCAFRPRPSWGLPKIKNEQTGRDKMLWIPRGVIIPCFKKGQIYRIRIRRPKVDILKPGDVKYYVMPGSGMDAMDIEPDNKVIVIVEAELDAMLISNKAGSIAGVVALGSAQNKPGASVYLCLKKTLRVLVALDYDAAGQKAWKWWSENFSNAKLWPVPEGKDPGDAFEKGINIKEWIQAGLPPGLNYKNA